MSVKTKHIILIGLIAIAGFATGRLAVRAALNLLIGGTLFGGDFL